MASNDSSSKSPLGSVYTPLLISLIGIVSTCIALVLYHFVFVKLCSRRTPATITSTEPLPQDTSVLTTGVDQKVLKTIPIIAYSAHEDGDKFFRVDQSECAVCLGELEHGELVRLLPNCKHAFHVSCIDEWFVEHTSCPICRSAIVVEVSLVVENQVPTTLTPPLSSLDGSNRAEIFPLQKDDQRGKDITAGNNVASSSGVKTKPFAMLHHSGSLVLPTDRTSPLTRGIIGLKRSLSLDQSSVIIDMQQERETGRDCSSSSSSSSKDDLTENRTSSRSMKHFDRVSSKLLMSFSRLRMGKINSDSLPY